MKHLSLPFIILSLSWMLSACDDDDFSDGNNRTVDIEQNNSEEIALGVIQSTLFAHLNSGLFDFLDANDTPENAIEDIDSRGLGYWSTCDVQGSMRVTYTREAELPHSPGDRISVDYEDCDHGDGVVLNGGLSGVYTRLDGINDQFIEITTDECVDNIGWSASGSASPVGGYSQAGRAVYVSSDDLYFVRNGDYLDVMSADVVVSQIHESEIVVVVNVYPDGGPNAAKDDVVYLVEDAEASLKVCQGYVRFLEINLDQLTSDTGELRTVLSGNISIIESTNDLLAFYQAVDNSYYLVSVTQGQREATFSLSDATIEGSRSKNEGVYSYYIAGDINGQSLPGILNVSTTSVINGIRANPYPQSGQYVVLGRGLESMDVTISDGRDLRIRIDRDGDSDGDQRGDFEEDLEIETTWDALFARDFVASD